MENSYIPKANEKEFCEWINLCTVRKTKEWISKIWVKDLQWNITEELLENIINADTYNWKPIIRSYASWHIFLDSEKENVYLVEIDKYWKKQWQFTWWSPLEEENKEVIIKENWIYKFDLEKVRNNARIRTKNRTSVEILEEFNKEPLVDWALMESEEEWNIYYKLVCLMHFIVKKYEWKLTFTWNENTIWGGWFEINKLDKLPNVAVNAYIVSKKALELV